MPTEEKLRDNFSLNAEVEYWKIMGQTKIIRVKSSSQSM